MKKLIRATLIIIGVFQIFVYSNVYSEQIESCKDSMSEPYDIDTLERINHDYENLYIHFRTIQEYLSIGKNSSADLFYYELMPFV